MIVITKMHMVNMDFKGMFYNFRIYSVLAKYCGFDLGSYLGHKKDQQGKPPWTHWESLIMGLVVSY